MAYKDDYIKFIQWLEWNEPTDTTSLDKKVQFCVDGFRQIAKFLAPSAEDRREVGRLLD